ncbi:MAG: ATP-binding protein [Spirochaetaceae bacterium]|jgi:predicted AAA+ superfamily ATPase|nr:ATP-binding protein [Spirochaetaceae bacterium]
MRRKIEQKLLEWKDRERMPLLLFGARQTGKTFTLNDFGERHFTHRVYVNLETDIHTAEYFAGNIEPGRLIRYLETLGGVPVIPGETLIILDEIQSCERALTALKYFCEKAPEYHVAAAGSLLGVAINRERYSFPVGKVENLSLYPLDFEEFLWALGEDRLAEAIRDAFGSCTPLPAGLHQKAIDLYRCYLIVGGMPACVSEFAGHKNTVLVQNIQSNIADNYVADMAKYAGKSDTVKIRGCFDSIPAQLSKENKKFQYKVVQRGGSAALFGASIEWLAQAGIALKCQRLGQAVNPIAVYADLSSFKLYMSDVGLLTMKSGIALQTILNGDPNVFMGALTENYIAQALRANNHPLYYWESEHTAELDFVLQQGADIIGVEVKKSFKTHSKSLNQFIQRYKPAYSIRFSEKNFGKADGILSLPHYAAFCL